MKNNFFQFVLSFLILFSVIITECGQREQKPKTEKKEIHKTETKSTKQPIVIDDFDKDPKSFSPQFPNFRFRSLGYSIFFERATVELTRVVMSDDDQALRIKYNLPSLHEWGNWLSIRREFDSLMDLTGYSGFKLDIKVEIPSDAKLRITLADAVVVEGAVRDELWWFDFEDNVLGSDTNQWRTLTIPFEKFYQSYGDGTRFNDGKLDLSKITAYEINIVSIKQAHPKGKVLVNSLVTF